MSNKKVLYIGGFDLPDKNAAAQRVISNSKIFRELGYEVKLVGLDKEPSVFAFDGFECVNHKYPSNNLEWLSYLTSTNRYKQIVKEFNPTIIVAYNYPAFALNRWCSFCRRKGIKILSDCTEWYPPVGGFIHRKIQGWDIKKRMTEVHLKMDGIISISRYLHDYYCSKNVKSILLPPLVDIENSKWRIQTNREDLKEIVLAYAGSPGFKDSLNKLVQIISELSVKIAVRFEIVGLDKEQFITTYNYNKSIPANIHFNGRLSHEATVKILSASDFQIFVRKDTLTNRAGFPTKFVESISSGVPVLTTLTSNLGDYLSDGLNGFILDNSSYDSLFSSIEKVLMLTRDEINKVKKTIDRETFDYHRFVPKMQVFLESL